MTHFKRLAIPSYLLAAFASLLLPSILSGQSSPTGYQHTWSTRLYANGNAVASDVATDGQGNPIAVGTVANDVYLAKYSAQTGTVLWFRRFAMSGTLQNLKVAVGTSGSIAIGLALSGTVNFGGGPPVGVGGGYDFIAAKFDSSGTVIWSRRVGSTSDDVLFGVGMNNGDDIWIGGTFTGQFTVGQTRLNTAGAGDAVVIRLASSDGVPQEGVRYGGSGHDVGISMVVDSGGNVLITGYRDSGISAFVAKFSGNATLLWANTYTRPVGVISASASGNCITTDQTGNVYVVGTFSGQLDLSGRQLTSNGLTDLFLAKLSSGGALLFASRYGNESADSCADVLVERSGNVLVTGGFSGTTDFGGGPLSSAGQMDIYLARLDGRDGAHIFSRRFGSSADDLGTGLSADSNSIYLTGNFTGLIDFGSGTLNGIGSDGFVAKFNQINLPFVSENGVVNNGSFAPGTSPLAPGSIAAVFGGNLTDGSTVLNSSFGGDGKLVTKLAGATVRINDTPAPIFYATPGQLGIQIPFEVAGQTTATVQVIVAGISSAPRTITIDATAPGIFTINQDGAGTAAVLHGSDSTPVTQQSPARPGEVIVLFATGLGQLIPSLATGAPSSGNRSFMTPTVSIDGLPGEVQFAGAAPGFVGLNQVNVRISASTRQTSDALLVLSSNGRQSNPVTIPIGQ